MSPQIERVKRALSDLAQGKMIILRDDENRENEGDLIIAAEKVTPEVMNFMIRHGSGIVCLALTSDRLKKLELPLMVSAEENTSLRGTPFTISIDAKDGITTGVSAADRTRTVHIAVQDDIDPNSLVKPGHIFPLQARDGGVLERQGHTEGAVDLARLAGFKPAAVLCEIMNPDGSMAHDEQIEAFATEHGLSILSIDDIITYRYQQENLILEEAETSLPIEHYGTFKTTVIKDAISHDTHIVLEKERIDASKPYLVRIHSSCVTGDCLPLNAAIATSNYIILHRITEEGMLIYLNQEGRGIGLFDKIRAYALQDHGFDTVEANQQLGLPADSRNYHLAANILRNHQHSHIRLLTNNLNKVNDLHKYGVVNVEREAMPSFHNEHNHHYLKTKNEKLNHAIIFDFTLELKRSHS